MTPIEKNRVEEPYQGKRFTSPIIKRLAEEPEVTEGMINKVIIKLSNRTENKNTINC